MTGKLSHTVCAQFSKKCHVKLIIVIFFMKKRKWCLAVQICCHDASIFCVAARLLLGSFLGVHSVFFFVLFLPLL